MNKKQKTKWNAHHQVQTEPIESTHIDPINSEREYNKVPAIELNSQQQVPTQPAGPLAPSQVTSSIPKPPYWSSMSRKQKDNWYSRHF